MSKTNFFVKHLKNINNFINNLLEKNLNKLNFKNLSFLFKNNKIILTFVALFVVFISYLLLPTFYNQNDVSKKLKNELQSKFDINFKFSNVLKISLHSYCGLICNIILNICLITCNEGMVKYSVKKVFV